MTTINLAVIAGDGIGPEVVGEGLKVLDVVAKKYGVEFKKTSYDLGAAFWHRTGEVLPDATLADLAKADVILLGAVGDPTVPSGVLERGLLLKLRFAFDHYINLRPARLMPGVTGPLATMVTIRFFMMFVLLWMIFLWVGCGGRGYFFLALPFSGIILAALAFSRLAPRSMVAAICFLVSAYLRDIRGWLFGMSNCLRYWAGLTWWDWLRCRVRVFIPPLPQIMQTTSLLLNACLMVRVVASDGGASGEQVPDSSCCSTA